MIFVYLYLAGVAVSALTGLGFIYSHISVNKEYPELFSEEETKEGIDNGTRIIFWSPIWPASVVYSIRRKFTEADRMIEEGLRSVSRENQR